MVAAQQNRSSMTSLIDDEGNLLKTFPQISNEAVRFFQNLLGKVDSTVTRRSQDVLTDLLKDKLTPEEAEELIKPVSIEEIKSTMFAIKGDKAPGPDGFSSHFFKAAWRIIGEDVVAAVRHFFSSSFILPCFNATVVALIPKNQSPRSIKEYRPISCCSMIYKCITKIMTNRMKMFIPSLVGNN